MISDLIHNSMDFPRRISRLATLISDLIPANARVLDIGCGDGSLDQLLMARRPDITIEGVDVLVREVTHIPVRQFDGKQLPFPDKSFDCAIFVDVLHHANEQVSLMGEAARVARQCVIIKDHKVEGVAAFSRLRFMDVVGNARYGVALPYDYWEWSKWSQSFNKLQLSLQKIHTDLQLYPWPFDRVFGAGLHFVAKLDTCSPSKA
ncbi:MAG: class I SAM-dependent methyltransferase [Candidatus Korobacteraceae bacterium]